MCEPSPVRGRVMTASITRPLTGLPGFLIFKHAPSSPGRTQPWRRLDTAVGCRGGSGRNLRCRTDLRRMSNRGPVNRGHPAVLLFRKGHHALSDKFIETTLRVQIVGVEC